MHVQTCTCLARTPDWFWTMQAVERVPDSHAGCVKRVPDSHAGCVKRVPDSHAGCRACSRHTRRLSSFHCGTCVYPLAREKSHNGLWTAVMGGYVKTPDTFVCPRLFSDWRKQRQPTFCLFCFKEVSVCACVWTSSILCRGKIT